QFPPEGDCTVHRTAIGIQDDCRAGDVVALHKLKKMTWRVRGNRAGCSNESLAVVAANRGGSLHAHLKTHRQRPIGRVKRSRQQSQWRRQSERSDRDGSVHSTPVSPPSPSSGVAYPRSGWTLAALNTPARLRLSALARFGSSVKKSLYPRKGEKFHLLGSGIGTFRGNGPN